jgi:hypothetical protein
MMIVAYSPKKGSSLAASPAALAVIVSLHSWELRKGQGEANHWYCTRCDEKLYTLYKPEDDRRLYRGGEFGVLHLDCEEVQAAKVMES